jgi:hypothetical protein
MRGRISPAPESPDNVVCFCYQIHSDSFIQSGAWCNFSFLYCMELKSTPQSRDFCIYYTFFARQIIHLDLTHQMNHGVIRNYGLPGINKCVLATLIILLLGKNCLQSLHRHQTQSLQAKIIIVSGLHYCSWFLIHPRSNNSTCRFIFN